jgi:hypothetical protein
MPGLYIPLMKPAPAEFSNDATKINIIILVLAIISIIASFNPGWHLWGLDSPKIFPEWTRLLLLAFILVLAIPKIGKIVSQFITNLINSLKDTQLTIIYVVLAVGCFALFVIFRSQNHFLGDGYTVMGNIKTGRFFYTTEPFDFLIHQIIFKILGSSESAVYQSYAFCSYACGVIFFWGLAYFIKNKTQLILSLFVAACFAVMQFFFGYVESYVFSFVLIFLYSLSAIQDYEKKRLSYLTITLLCLAVAFHLSCAVLVPSAIFLATLRYSTKKRYTLLVGSSVLGLLLSIAYLIISGNIALKDITAPLWKTSTNPYSLISIRHILDIGNLALLNYPLLLFIILMGEFRKRIFLPFYLILIGPGLLFTLVVDPKLGAFRDWDLLSISSGPILAFLIGALARAKRLEYSKAYSIYIILGLFGILHTGSWIYQNALKDKSYALVKEAVKNDIHYSREYRLASQNKAWAVLANRFANDHDEMLRAQYERYYGDPSDYINTCQLAEALGVLGHNEQAIEMVQKNWERFRSNLYSATKLSTTMIELGRLMEAEQICQAFISTGGQDTLIYFNLANIKQLKGQTDSSYYYLDKSFSINPNKPIDLLYKFYIECFTTRNDNLAVAGFNRIMPKLPDGPKAFASTIVELIKSGNIAGTDSLRNGIILSMKKQVSQ